MNLTMQRVKATAAGAALIAGVIGVGASTARAAIYDRGSFSFHFEDSFAECGLTNLHSSTDLVDHFVQRVGTGSQAGLFPGGANIDVTTVVTNLDNGKWFTIKEDFRDQQLPATNLGGTLWLGRGQTVGTTTVLDSDGRVVARDAGRQLNTTLFDDLGDHAPGGELIAELETRVVGHHPLAEMTEEQGCALEVALIG